MNQLALLIQHVAIGDFHIEFEMMVVLKMRIAFE